MRSVSLWINVTLAVIAMSCLSASAQAASGLEPGVHVDPGSPAAKEYSLPLNQARETGAAPSSSPSPQASSEGSLFGAGIKPPGSGGPTAGSGGSTRAAKGALRAPSVHAPASRADGGAGPQPSPPQTVLRAARDQGSSGVDGSTLALLGGAVAILVLGGFGGTVLRHSRRPA